MSVSQIFMSLLLVVVLLSSARLIVSLKGQARLLPLLFVLMLQVASAALLYFTLFPPDRFAVAERLQILTANAKPEPLLNTAKVRVLALPEASKQISAERVPDLASVLRRFPGVTEIEVRGDGLPMRDWEAAQGVLVKYKSVPIKQGIVELGLPATTAPGERWVVTGRVAQTAPTTVELLDPGKMLVARVLTDANGHFSLSDTSRVSGRVLYQLRVLNAQKKILETLTIPVITVTPQTLRILSVSGGANPELKYLKRWAQDAGVNLQSSIALGMGMQIQTAPVSFNERSLRELDLIIIDERAWMALSEPSKQAMRVAIAQGLGVLLRITGPLSAKARAEWRTLGFSITESDAVQMLRLSEPNQQSNLPELMRQPVLVQASDAVSLYSDNQGQALGLWRAEQLGRVGVWWLNDSFRLVLAGHPNVYGAMWSQLITTLARAKQKPVMSIPAKSIWVNERAVFCGLANNASIETAQGQQQKLLLVTQGANKNCAAYWPEQAGWHTLNSANQMQAFYVRATNEAPALHQRVIQQAMMTLTETQAQTRNNRSVAVPGLHWPYFLAWLLITTLLWWLERIRWVVKK
jgi:hypothetical protein